VLKIILNCLKDCL